ncbi:tRNA preQ1(34) S-adenosylmethionine ribosyltransferase-isomerase QueA [Candidatus Saccharibacteria bacterium]|nr:tRNA preQ1(34) S-adenosylmethionine ribosyltransferase-isomerase QueA [Candidatus Saccharibacteria bacterium]
MQITDYSYDLPEKNIAQHPPRIRGASKLLVLQRDTGRISHGEYSDLTKYLQPGDVIVLNNTKVIKARLIATNNDGKKRELLLLEQHGHEFGIHIHSVLYRGKIHPSEQLNVRGHTITVRTVKDGGIAIIESPENLLEISERFGSVPLPPYMKRDASKEDIERYQTVFAEKAGSVAAPTASLNFTRELEQALQSKGVVIVYLTLHVGLGTFLPIRVDDVTKHAMHSEYFEIPKETVAAIQKAKQSANRVVAIGTTVTRTLEYCANDILHTQPKDLSGEADIFIYPGYSFKVVDALLTNFHAPRTTVLMLAAGFAGWENLKAAYEEAKQKNYAFLSYGDSMLIL